MGLVPVPLLCYTKIMKYDPKEVEITQGNPCNPYPPNWESVQQLARLEGFTVINTAPDRLLLDLDDETAEKQFTTILPIIQSAYGLNVLDMWRSKSGIGKHVVLACVPLSFRDRIGLQAVLGSDRKREALALLPDRLENEISFLLRPPTKDTKC